MKIVVALLAAVLLVTAPLLAFAQTRPDILEVIEVSGEIGNFTAEGMRDKVDAINENPKIRAVLLIVNSPGGGATASSALYEELSRIKVPVVGWCDSVCASGGMYALMAPSVKYIGVRSETIAGSIGVIAQSMRFNRLLDKLYIDADTYKSGELKDSFSPVRAPTAADAKYIQSIVDGLAESFYGVVGKVRKITDWGAVKSARIFIGKQTVAVGLADAVMTRPEAIAKAKDLSGSKSIYTREELKKMSSAAEPRLYGLAVPVVRSAFGDVPWLIEKLKEISSGASVTFQYRMPFIF